MTNKELNKIFESAFYLPEYVDPIIIDYSLPSKSIETIRVILTEDEYKICERFSSTSWATEKTGTVYDEGMANTKEDPHRVERTGALGEMAFAKVFRVPMNIGYIQGGDNKDFILFENLKINLKTAIKKDISFNKGLVVAVNSKGKPVPLPCELYAFALLFDDPTNKRAIASLIGYDYRRNIKNRQPVKAVCRKSNHLNYETPYEELFSIVDLYNKHINFNKNVHVQHNTMIESIANCNNGEKSSPLPA
jgi:hypothetical protein